MNIISDVILMKYVKQSVGKYQSTNNCGWECCKQYSSGRHIFGELYAFIFTRADTIGKYFNSGIKSFRSQNQAKTDYYTAPLNEGNFT